MLDVTLYSRLQDQLASLRVLGHIGGQTHSRRTATGSVLRSGHEIEDVLQHLGLGCTRITAQQEVNFRSEVLTTESGMLLLSAAKKLQQYALLDVVVLVNGWRNSPGQAVINVRLLGQQL